MYWRSNYFSVMMDTKWYEFDNENLITIRLQPLQTRCRGVRVVSSSFVCPVYQYITATRSYSYTEHGPKQYGSLGLNYHEYRISSSNMKLFELKFSYNWGKGVLHLSKKCPLYIIHFSNERTYRRPKSFDIILQLLFLKRVSLHLLWQLWGLRL